MSLQNSILEATGFDFGCLGPPFCELLGSIFEGFGIGAFILEGLGTFEGFGRPIFESFGIGPFILEGLDTFESLRRHSWHRERQECLKTWQDKSSFHKS